MAADMQLDELTGLAEEIEASGLSARDQKLEFIRRYLFIRVSSAIFAHEGRHSIDQTYFADAFEGWDAAEREFRAKLSEIVFSPEPRMTLGGILGQTVNDSGHGRANLMIREALHDWMAAHQSEIEHLDPQRPLLAQADLVTEGHERCHVPHRCIETSREQRNASMRYVHANLAR
jgi:hypothetical protein